MGIFHGYYGHYITANFYLIRLIIAKYTEYGLSFIICTCSHTDASRLPTLQEYPPN